MYLVGSRLMERRTRIEPPSNRPSVEGLAAGRVDLDARVPGVSNQHPSVRQDRQAAVRTLDLAWTFTGASDNCLEDTVWAVGPKLGHLRVDDVNRPVGCDGQRLDVPEQVLQVTV